MDRVNQQELVLPLIPLRELVTFPSAIMPIRVGRERSVNALKYARQQYNSYIFLSIQKNQVSESPNAQEIAEIGIVARVERAAVQVNGSYRVIIHGLERARINRFVTNDNYFLVNVTTLPEVFDKNPPSPQLGEALIDAFEEYISHRQVRMHGLVARLKPDRLSEVSDVIMSVLEVSLQVKQEFLEELNVNRRAQKVRDLMQKELNRLKSAVPPKRQRIKTSNKTDGANESKQYRHKIENAGLPGYVMARAREELERFEMMPPFAAESTVSRAYLDWILAVPWQTVKEENKDIANAAEILDRDHYGLKKAKDRILDYLAVRQLVEKPSGEILCFAGPPGVGKSSLSRSIAGALKREFVRISLGGVKDEAEIRGHRRTYVGAYPGQIIKGLKKAGTKNPVFLLDEIDKLDSDFRGDPASALLEVLDPEQNHEFADHYLDLEIDLSRVFFITTANTVDLIPEALLDRMEVIEIPGYTEQEKLNIAKKYLLKKLAGKNGLTETDFDIPDQLILDVINLYTREAGVRELERQLGVIIRKIARHYVESGKKPGDKTNGGPYTLTPQSMESFLGVPRFTRHQVLETGEVGVAVGLAWTMAGGDILIIEARSLSGGGELILTGSLGDVMKESSAAAFSYSKIKLAQLGFDIESIGHHNIHLHLPEGAVPKDGPSAGVTLAVAMISLLTGIPVKPDVSMTGEITLRGKILPVGGIKEKIIAAHRYGFTNVIIPTENEKELKEDIPSEILERMTIHAVDNMDNLLDLVLEKTIKPKNVKSTIISVPTPARTRKAAKQPGKK